MKSDVAPSLSNATAASATPAHDAVEQRRTAVAKLPDECPGHAHEHAHAPTEVAADATDQPQLPSTLRHPSSTVAPKKLWRSVAELENSPEFMELVEREFPKAASEWTDELSRRHFMKIMGASLAFAGAAGCWKRPDEIVVPYVVPPEQVVPGKPLFFATTYTMEGAGRGVIVESHQGRPTKIEGNPDHPASLGTASAHMQASILSMYDPERSQSLMRTGDNATWDRFIAEITPRLAAQRAVGGTGLRLLMTPNASPTAERQLKLLMEQYPSAKVHTYDPLGHMSSGAGAQESFGENVNTVYQIDKAKVLLSLDSNFLQETGGSLRYAKQFINGRRVRADHHDPKDMNRLYVVESCPTITGAMADHKLRVKPSAVEVFARALLAQINGDTAAGAAEFPWLPAAAKDLAANRGASVVIAGDHQTPVVHALAHQINAALGNVGQTLYYTNPIYSTVASGSIAELITDASAGKVELLFILGGNPVYDLPGDQDFKQVLQNVPYKVRLGAYDDETSFQCHWHIPETHYLEMWSDARAFDGTASIVQPLIAPLYDSKSMHTILAVITGQADRSDYQLVRDTWREAGGANFESWWREALNKGVIPNTAFAPKQVTAKAAPPPAPAATGGIEVIVRPDPNVLDGRFANNGWLQELPRPLTKLTWDNVIFISQKMAQSLDIPLTDKWDDAWGYYVTVTANGQTVTGPAWVVPGHPDDAVTVFLGYGRSRAGVVGTNLGFDVAPLRSSANPWFATNGEVKRGEGRLRLACTQMHQLMKGSNARDLIRVNPISDYEKAKYGPHGSQAGHGGGHGDDPENHAAEDATPASPHGAVAQGTVSGNPLPAPHFPSDGHDHGATEASPTRETAFDKKYRNVPLTLYDQKMPSDPPYDMDTNQWGMSIDNNACIGCNACVIACQSENNIPVIGKTEVIFGREMHWLRIDTYYGGDSVHDVEGPFFEPIMCMHCEAAPCEVVCPVEATSHSHEGLNEMTYNRCVGTKYCSNNCPYKVRRFNFFRYKDDQNESIALMRNPNVTIRTRGVMEKCTFCVQRISGARIEAKKHGGPDGGPSYGKVTGDLVPKTACQQTCPTDAIIFGNLTDVGSPVRKLKSEPTDYGLLTELNTRPRVTYMGRFTNPNPEIGHG